VVSGCLSTGSEGCFGFFFTTFFVLNLDTSFGTFTCFLSCALSAASDSALCIFSSLGAGFLTVVATFFTGSGTFFVSCDAEADASVGAVIGNTFDFADTLAFGLTVSVLAILPVSKLLLLAVLMVLALLMILDVLLVLPTVDVDVLRRSGLSVMNARIFFISNGALDGSLALIGAFVPWVGCAVAVFDFESDSPSVEVTPFDVEVAPVEEEELEITGTGLVFGIIFERVLADVVLAKGLVTFTEGSAAWLVVVVVVVVVVDMMEARIGRGRCAGSSCGLGRHLFTVRYTLGATR